MEGQGMLPGTRTAARQGFCAYCGGLKDLKRDGECCSAVCRVRLYRRRKEEERQSAKAAKALAAERRHHALEGARAVARVIAESALDGCCSVEDVRERYVEDGTPWPEGNWAGSIFSDGCWEWTGRMVKALHPGGHGRLVKVWRLK